MDFIKTFTVTPEEGSQVTVAGEVPYEELQKHRAAALQALGKNIELDGFRKGHVPEDILVQKIGEGTLLGEMAERALAKIYPTILTEHSIDAVGYPQIQITKLAPENPLGFTATIAVMPSIELPDYKKIAADVNKEKGSTEVTDEDIEAQIKDILRQKLAYERLQKKAQPQQHTHADGTVHEGPAHGDDTTDLPTPETVGDAAAEEETGATEPSEITDDELPELTDEYVQGLGQPGQFESVDDFKTKLREHLAIEKEKEVNAAHRAKVTDKIIEASTFELPQVMIDAELNQMFAQMEEDLTRANLSMEDYLGHIKKTKADLTAEWSPAAEKRARLQLILNEIAKKENVQPDEEQLEAQIAQLKEQYKDADEARVRMYVTSVLTNEATMQMLETQ